MKLTVSDKETLKSIIIDEITEANEKKKSSEELQKEAEELANKSLGPELERLEELEKQRELLNSKVSALENTLAKKVFNKTGHRVYHYNLQNLKSNPEIVRIERDKLEVKYKLIPIPSRFEVEKLIVKSSCKDYQDLIKSIITLISKRK